MSSTMRTRIWSAMSGWVSDLWGPGGGCLRWDAMTMGRRFTGPSDRVAAGPIPPEGARSLRAARLLGQDRLDQLRHDDAVVVHEALERDAGRPSPGRRSPRSHGGSG